MNNFIPVSKAHVKKSILLQSSCCHIAILDPTIHLLGLLINGRSGYEIRHAFFDPVLLMCTIYLRILNLSFFVV